MQKVPKKSLLRRVSLSVGVLLTTILALGIDLSALQTTPPAFATDHGSYTFQSQKEALVKGYKTSDVELGDVDSDGDLDLLLVNRVSPHLVIYLNNNGVYDEIMDWRPEDVLPRLLIGTPVDAAWGDADGDGDLDLAVATWQTHRPHYIYRNNEGVLENEPVFIGRDLVSSQRWDAQTVAWGDLSGDGKLDLVFGHGRNNDVDSRMVNRNTIIYNNATETPTGDLMFEEAWESISNFEHPTKDVAIADMDGDGDLDIAIANGGSDNEAFPNTLIRNLNVRDAGDVFNWQESLQEAEIPGTSQSSRSVAWGNLVGDEKPELIVGNIVGSSVIYCNTSTRDTPQLAPCWDTDAIDELENLNVSNIAVADVDANGHLDIALSGYNDPNFILCGAESAETPALRLCWNSNEQGLNLLTQRVVFGDINGDGLLDLVEGNGEGANIEQPVHFYYNLQPLLRHRETQDDNTINGLISSAALGYLDDNNSLDLIIGRTNTTEGVADNFYFNDGQGIFSETPLMLEEIEDEIDSRTQSIALGDFDGNGDLDLAYGGGTRLVNQGEQPMHTYIYRNDGVNRDNPMGFTLVWKSPNRYVTTSVAWGDVNGDDYLDLAIGNVGALNQVFVYLPDEETFANKEVWVSPEPRQTYKLAWGDVDNDGDLDLAVANFNQPNQLFINEGGELGTESVWQPSGDYPSTDLAWADIDSDGLLDLVVSNGIQNSLSRSLLYLNKGGNFAPDPDWVSDPMPAGNVAVADFDNDGDQDVAFSTFSGDDNRTKNLLYFNEGGMLGDVPFEWEIEKTSRSAGGLARGELLWGDIDGDGDLDLLDLYRRNTPINRRIMENIQITTENTNTRPPTIHISQTEVAGINPSAEVHEDTIEIPFTLRGELGNQRFDIQAQYSLNGGGNWQTLEHLTVVTELPPEADVEYLEANVEYKVRVNMLRNGLLGQMNNFVLRLIATPYLSDEVPIPYRNEVPGPFLYGSPATSTYPFRIEGRTIGVDVNGTPVANAHVFRQVGGEGIFEPYRNSIGWSRTGANGYLQAIGELKSGDRLVALSPVEVPEDASYRHFYVSHAPIKDGIDFHTVTVVQEQKLSIEVKDDISENHHLYLFDLDISLEWDARDQPLYLTILEENIQRTSEILYDLTDGQMALGEINIYMAKEQWRESHIQVYASNRYRPNADIGGIVSQPTDLIFPTAEPTGTPTATPSPTTTPSPTPESTPEPTPTRPSIVLTGANSALYSGTVKNAVWPGQVRMPANWNRFGEPGNEGGEDWARTLAHELAHYIFFLPDNYLLTDGPEDYLLEVNNNNYCGPSVMRTAYANTEEDDSEFLPTLGEIDDCQHVIAYHLTNLADWEVITALYGIEPHLNADKQPMSGPDHLPLAVTQIEIHEPDGETNFARDNFFFVREGENGNRSAPLSPRTISSYLIRAGDYVADIIALGAPIGNQIHARGAQIGDQLCVYDSTSPKDDFTRRSGCSTIAETGVPLKLTDANWSPIINIKQPVIPEDHQNMERPEPYKMSLEIEVEIIGDDADVIYLQIFPNLLSATTQYASPVITVNPIDGIFSSQVELPDIPVDGYIRIWIDNKEQRDGEALVPFFLGGGWLPDHWASGSDHAGFGPDHWASGVGYQAGWNAPVSTGDGQLALFNLCSAFDKAPAYTLQALPTVPDFPAWIVPVGSAYRIEIDEEHEFKHCQQDGVATSILFSYLERDLPNRVYEDELQIYYYEENTKEWMSLNEVTRNPVQNLVTGAYKNGAHTYILGLSSSIELQAGWNLISYPSRKPQAIAPVIEPITHTVELIYGYSREGGFQEYCPDRFDEVLGFPTPGPNNHLCDPDHPVNWLSEFEFGHGYWVYANSATTLRLPVDVIGEQFEAEEDESVETMPAIFQGTFVDKDNDWRGAKLVAWVGDRPCGETQLEANAEGSYGFVLPVHQQLPDSDTACAESGDQLSFSLNGFPLRETQQWDNGVIHTLQLSAPIPADTSNSTWLVGVLVIIVCGLFWKRAAFSSRI